MLQDMQQLLEKIQRDGVNKANAEAELILEKANEQARQLLENAKQDAAKIVSIARQEAEAFERRAEETIRQSARDTVLTVEKSVTQLLTRLLLTDVNEALSNTDVAASLALEAARTYLSGKATVEIVSASKLADALRAKLAADAMEGVQVVTDEATGAGFRIRLANGRVEHAFTGAAVTEALARQLRPRLAALMNPA